MMKKVKLIIVGGFLGSGKTTLLWDAATRLSAQGLNVGLVTNDQAPDLVDSELLKLNGLRVEEVSGSCFCCNFNGFADAISRIQNGQEIDVIIAEPVGSCTDLSATIMQPVKQYLDQSIKLAPLTVLADPVKLSTILSGKNAGLHPDAAYIYRKQLEESDIILVGKSDMVDARTLAAVKSKAEDVFPDSIVMTASVETDSRVNLWLEAVLNASEAGQRIVEVDYDVYASGEAALGWLNGAVQLQGDITDWDSFAHTFMQRLAAEFDRENLPVGHVKAIIRNGVRFTVGNITGTAQSLTMRGAAGKSDNAKIVVNARVETSPEKLHHIVRNILDSICDGQYEINTLAWRYLQPGRPQPTYRFNQTVSFLKKT